MLLARGNSHWLWVARTCRAALLLHMDEDKENVKTRGMGTLGDRAHVENPDTYGYGILASSTD